jgi:chemotaxis protein MotA
MFVIIGGVVVLVGVLGGFIIEGGPVLLLVQPAELLIIGGAAVGSILIGAPMKVLKGLVGRLPGLFSGAGSSKRSYLELLTALYEAFINAKKNGFISLDQDVSDPANSSIFSKYPGLLKNHHALAFI